jgi:hypothetical protein
MKNKGFLLVMMQPPATLEDEFNAWYDTEHVPERVAVPGFETGLRYVCIDGHPDYLAMYDTQDPEVFATEGYLRVSFDRASPWTKRVTSRVKVYRYAGRQVYPGTALTRPCARVMVLRFRNLPASAESSIVAGMRANFEERPETLQVRVFVHDTGGSSSDYLGFVELRGAPSRPLDTARFGTAADALDLVNTYAPY